MSQLLFTTIRLDELVKWIEQKLKSKYKAPLEGIEKRFLPVFSGLEELLRGTLSIISTLKDTTELLSNKVYLDNMMYNLFRCILNDMIIEYPTLIDYSYVESFLFNFQERFDNFKTSFHPLIHLTLQDAKQHKALHNSTKVINSILSKLPGYIEDIKTRLDLARPLLMTIDSCVKLFKDPAATVLNDIKIVNELNKAKDEYEFLKAQLKRFPVSNDVPVQLKKMTELILAFNESQIELEATLEPIHLMCQIVKNKGKKIIREDSKEDICDLLSYVNLILKPDFYSLLMQIYNKDDLVYAIMHLQSHKNLFNELKKIEPYKSDLAVITFVKEDELKNLISKWQDLFTEIEKLRKNSEFASVFSEFVNNLAVPFEDLRMFSAKLKEFHKSVLHFNATNGRFKRLRYKVFKFCLEEFGERVEVLWPGK